MAMADASFSPVSKMELARGEIYREWLGIKCANPSYYGLLSLPELESDSTVIMHAGRRVKRKLRAYQIGPYRKQALDMLAEVGQAVAVLTSPEKKPAYDRELMGRWKSTVEELYRAHCEGAPREPAVLEAWLAACVSRGVPVTRVLPAILRKMRPHLKEWPPHGEHKLGLPISVWIYRDAVILGQCLHVGTLEHRAEAVKHIQKSLGVTEGLARLVAEEVSRSLHLFAHTRFVTRAKRDPEEYLVRLGRRVRRCGGHLGRRADILTAVASLLGLNRKSLDRAIEGLAQPAAEVSAARKAALASKKAAGEAKMAVDWFRFRPQVVMIGLALAVGMAALAVAVLVASGVWNPWGRTEGSPTPEESPVVVAPAEPDTVKPPAPSPLPPSEPVRISPSPPSEADLQGLEDFIKKYPSGKAPGPAGGESQPPSAKPPAQPRPPGSKTPTFFSVPAQRAPDKKGPSGKAPEAGKGTAAPMPPKEPVPPPPPPEPAAQPKEPA